MPKPASHTLIWSLESKAYVLLTCGQPPQTFFRGNEELWFAWLRTHSCFSFQGQCGHLNVLKEARRRGTGYWYAYHTEKGRARKRYLGGTPRLTLVRLEQVAQELDGLPAPLQQTQDAPSSEQMGVLLSAKLSPPRLPRFLVERARLFRELDAACLHPLTLVSAPAGSGKTTLLSAWAATCSSSLSRTSKRETRSGKSALVWLSLEDLDNEPIRFWEAVIAALRTCLPAFAETALSLLHSPQSPPLSTVLLHLLKEMEQIGRELIFIMDDYHVLSDQSIRDSMYFFLDHLPVNAHLILLTRADPDLPLPRLRARSQLLELRDADLRFTEAETASFLRDTMGIPLEVEDLVILHSRTEGWIAGLHLAALSIRKQQNLSRAVADFAGDHRYLLDYVQQDILRRLPGPLQDFLLQTSIVTRMNAEICSRITAHPERGECQHILEELERANLFVVSLDEHRQWYRYHDLFREALLAQLHASQPQLVPLLHSRAARFYEEGAEWREAIAHAFSAPDYTYAASLMEQAAESFWVRGEVRAIQDWVLALPDAVLRTHLHLAFNAAFRFFVSVSITTETVHASVAAQVERCCACMEGLVRRKANFSLSEAEETLIRLRVAVLRALVKSRDLSKRGETERLRVLVQEVESLPADAEMSWNLIRFTIPFFFHTFHQGDEASLLPRLQAEVQVTREQGELMLMIRLIVWLAFILAQTGHLRQAHQEALEGLSLNEGIGGQTTWPGYLSYCLLLVSYASNQLEEAAAWLKKLTRIAEDWQQIELLAASSCFCARLALIRKDFGAAEQERRRLEALVEHEHYTLRAPWVNILQVQIWLAQGNQEEASAWAAQVFFSEESYKPLHRWEILMAVRVSLAQQRYAQAAEVLSRLENYFHRPGALDAALEWMALSVIALDRCGKRAQSQEMAHHLLAVAAPEGYVRLTLDTGEPLMKEVFEIWLQADPREIAQIGMDAISRSTVRNMLARLDQKEAQPIRGNAPSSPLLKLTTYHMLLEPLSRQEQLVLRRLCAGQTYAEMAQALVVSPNTIKTQVSSIYRKLGVSRRAEAIATATNLHLL